MRMRLLVTALALLTVLVGSFGSFLPVYAAGGFDEFGYNYQAMIFVGKADGVDRKNDGLVWGDATYANDLLVMKWNKAWDNARFHACPDPKGCPGDDPAWQGAWEDNEWNGAVDGGSGEVWHYKIIWVGSELEDSPYWREGGYAIWGVFEVIMDQGMTIGEGHQFLTHAIPTGYGP